MNQDYRLYASAAFGIEGMVARELRGLNMRGVKADTGGVSFEGTAEDAFLCNLRLRFSDRVYIILAEGECLSFEDLYQAVQSIDWSRYADGTEAINVSCHCVKSMLMSERDCQSVAKKSIINQLMQKTGRQSFPETGADLSVRISVRSNHLKVLLNTSGASLSRRGYRTWNGEAPLKESLAAALVELSPWTAGLPFWDPCCGTGTIVIEAAFMAVNRSPGLYRSFAMEQLSSFRSVDFRAIRARTESIITLPPEDYLIGGSDIDQQALILAGRHAEQAHISDLISFSRTPLQALQLRGNRGIFLCNPPYGERLSNQKESRKLYHDLHILKDRHAGWSLCAISSDPSFERSYGKRADRIRRLYNGRLECNFYIFY